MNRPHKSAHWSLYVGLTGLVILCAPHLPAPYSDKDVMLAAIGGIWALAFYRQERHAEDARFLKELLADFNGRYNELNDDLQRALWSSEDFGEAARLKFIDYFNLCAEEWLFWQRGYIDDAVWRSWENGMRQYASDPRVVALWTGEAASDSYYGFEFPAKSLES